VRAGFVRVNGLGLAYIEAGKGPLVVVLHGFPDTAHSFEGLLGQLAREGFHAVAPFLRGYPPTELPADRDYTLRTLAGDLIGLVDALGAPKAVVVGHDWGSVIAQVAVKLQPDLFDRVVLAGFPHLRSFLTITPRQLRRSIYMAQFQLPFWPERRLPHDDFAWITEELMKIADACCGGKVVSILEGGYSLEGLASGTAAHLRVLMGAQ